MRNVGKASATAPVRFLVDGKTLTTSSTKTVGAGKSVTVTALWKTKGLKGAHTVTAVADPANIVKELDEADNRGATTVHFS